MEFASMLLMATTTEPTLDVQVDRALASLKRRRAFKEAWVIALLIAAGMLLLGLTAIMYHEPLESTQPSQQPTQP